MPSNQDQVSSKESKSDLYRSITKYGRPNLEKAIVQLIVTLGPYLILWAFMVFTIQRQYSYWITLALAVIGGAFLNVWNFTQLQELLASELGLTPEKIPELATKLQNLLMSFYGIIGVAPILGGILIGALVAGWK